jgi:outer membrane protein assembly factor BamA
MFKLTVIGMIAAPAALLASAVCPATVDAQEDPAPRARWVIAGVPAVNYDSDEGFGYGAVAELYRFGTSSRRYQFTIQPTVQLSTRGRQEVSVFFDAPHLLPEGWRLDAFAGSDRQVAAPFYGLGNHSIYEEALDDPDGANPYFYRFGRERRQLMANVQRRLGPVPVRALVGAGIARVSVDPTPHDEGTTLLEQQLNGTVPPPSFSNHVRAGLIWDTRDVELGPTSGVWSEILVQRFDERIGSDHGYTRWTFTDRRYFRLGSNRTVFANRILLQGVEGDAPMHDLFLIQTSFKQQEGLGGARSIRGLPKNRYVGEGLALWNAEVRWRAADFTAAGRPFHVVLSGFVDSGRVWEHRIIASELLQDLHHGAGGGVRLGMGDSFTVAVDVGRSGGNTPMYIGLGYLF